MSSPVRLLASSARSSALLQVGYLILRWHLPKAGLRHSPLMGTVELSRDRFREKVSTNCFGLACPRSGTNAYAIIDEKCDSSWDMVPLCVRHSAEEDPACCFEGIPPDPLAGTWPCQE